MNNLPAVYARMLAVIAKCSSAVEAKTLHDQADAMETFARISKDRSAEEQCRKIRVAAARKLGEILRRLPRQPHRLAGRHPGGRARHQAFPSETPETGSPYARALAELRITRKRAGYFQQLAATPEEAFRQAMAVVGATPNQDMTAEITQLLAPGRSRRLLALLRRLQQNFSGTNARPVVKSAGCVTYNRLVDVVPWAIEFLEDVRKVLADDSHDVD